jgi:hypothetical protein
MSWWHRFRSSPDPIPDEEELTALGDAPDDLKEDWHRQRAASMKGALDPGLVAEIEGASDEETEAGIAEEIRRIKRRNPHEWKLLLASLPKENQDQLREIKRRYKIR